MGLARLFEDYPSVVFIIGFFVAAFLLFAVLDRAGIEIPFPSLKGHRTKLALGLIGRAVLWLLFITGSCVALLILGAMLGRYGQLLMIALGVTGLSAYLLFRKGCPNCAQRQKEARIREEEAAREAAHWTELEMGSVELPQKKKD
jgi:mannose/fructose/N-acetylgalactosamine-specific phosphotransferase system component IIC